jgi:hypothetical protein
MNKTMNAWNVLKFVKHVQKLVTIVKHARQAYLETKYRHVIALMNTMKFLIFLQIYSAKVNKKFKYIFVYILKIYLFYSIIFFYQKIECPIFCSTCKYDQDKLQIECLNCPETRYLDKITNIC